VSGENFAKNLCDGRESAGLVVELGLELFKVIDIACHRPVQKVHIASSRIHGVRDLDADLDELLELVPSGRFIAAVVQRGIAEHFVHTARVVENEHDLEVLQCCESPGKEATNVVPLYAFF